MKNRNKLIVVIGAYPEIGKGTFSASCGYLIQQAGLNVNILKFDGYLNFSNGTTNPYHTTPKFKYFNEEVFVLKDGFETEADEGYYERFLNRDLREVNNLTNGKVFRRLMVTENKSLNSGKILKFLHAEEIIKEWIRRQAQKFDVTILEVGGTIGDPENYMLFKAINDLKHSLRDIYEITILISPYFHPKPDDKKFELSYRTKLIRQSFMKARELALIPDIIVLRVENTKEIPKNDIAYISSDCEISEKNIFFDPNCKNVYELPSVLSHQKFIFKLLKILNLKPRFHCQKDKRIENYASTWNAVQNQRSSILIGILGETVSYDSYISLKDAIQHASVFLKQKTEVVWLDGKITNSSLRKLFHKIHGLIVGEGVTKIKEKTIFLNLAYENKKPTMAISFGADLAVAGYIKNSLGKNIHIEEIKNDENLLKIRKTKLILGEHKHYLNPKTLARKIYKKNVTFERSRHCSWINNQVIKVLKKSNMIISGTTVNHNPTIFEVKNHPFYLAVKFHPEYKSRPGIPHPIFISFLKAIINSGLKQEMS